MTHPHAGFEANLETNFALVSAYHTDEVVLATVAYLDFASHLRAVFQDHGFVGAISVWSSAVEIQHYPPAPDRIPEPGGDMACSLLFAGRW